jgi:hypothetical protein
MRSETEMSQQNASDAVGAKQLHIYRPMTQPSITIEPGGDKVCAAADFFWGRL